MSNPLVSIGLPVYNAENFLEIALNSICNQTYDNFELIISDNGSNDSTKTICKRYAQRDNRIKFYLNDYNRGATWNFNHVYKLSSGKYFKWAAHDDFYEVDFLKQCVNYLENHPRTILCYTSMHIIDYNGNIINTFPCNNHTISNKPEKRFYVCWQMPPQQIIFGLIRRDILKYTNLIGDFASSDRVLVGHLSLIGQMMGLPKALFFYRTHKDQSTGYRYQTKRERIKWYNPYKNTKFAFPHWRLLYEYCRIIWKSQISIPSHFICCLVIIRWIIRYRKQLINNIFLFE